MQLRNYYGDTTVKIQDNNPIRGVYILDKIT